MDIDKLKLAFKAGRKYQNSWTEKFDFNEKFNFDNWLAENKQLLIHGVVKSSCDYWESNSQISTATSCKNCGKEKWEH